VLTLSKLLAQPFCIRGCAIAGTVLDSLLARGTAFACSSRFDFEDAFPESLACALPLRASNSRARTAAEARLKYARHRIGEL
jgi:hypothetical protein